MATQILTKKGSISFNDEDGRVVTHLKGDSLTAAEYKQVPNRQQQFFEQEARSEEGPDPDNSKTTPAEIVADTYTVEQLQDALEDAGVDFGGKAKKAELVALYVEHVFYEEQ